MSIPSSGAGAVVVIRSQQLKSNGVWIDDTHIIGRIVQVVCTGSDLAIN